MKFSMFTVRVEGKGGFIVDATSTFDAITAVCNQLGVRFFDVKLRVFPTPEAQANAIRAQRAQAAG